MAADAELLREDGSRIQIGDRLSSDDSYGTVKFIGCVPPTKGLWLGVEWDDPTRGKHDGSHEGVRYFQTRYPTSGSFVRPKKVNLGIDCMLAIKERYGVQLSGDAGVDTEELYVLSADNKATVVEMVGAEKINERQSKLDRLTEVSVRGTDIYGVGSGCQLSQMIPNVVELDLSLNLLTSWEMVAKICQQLPHLYNLHVSENLLSSPIDPGKLASAFTKITILYLNKVDLSWQQVLECCCMFPSLEKVYLCENSVETIHEPIPCPCLKMITLESNKITSWEGILKLGGLKKLQTLVVTNNAIEAMYFPDVPHGKKSELFPSLRQLYFTGKNLKEWSAFDELNKLQSLTELNFGQLPNQEEAELVRQIAIAKVANLRRCCRTLVKDGERKGAEVDYLKRYGPEWIKSGGNQDPTQNNPSAQFQSQHPRFQALVDKWGAPENSEMKQQSKSLKDSLMTLKIYCPQAPEKGTAEKNIPLTMTVRKLRTLIKRIFHVEVDFFLSYISKHMPEREIEFDNELRQLSFYSVEPGDTILVKWYTV